MESSSDDDGTADGPFEASQPPLGEPCDLRTTTHAKLVVNIKELGLRPDLLQCRHTESCRCKAIVDIAASRTHQSYGPGRLYSRLMPGDKCALSWLKNDAIASILPGPLGEVDLVACSAGGLAHVVALGSPLGTAHPIAEFWGAYQANRSAVRDGVWEEVCDALGEAGANEFLSREGLTAEKAGKALVAPVSGIVSPSAWVNKNGDLPGSRPLGPLQELVKSSTGRQMCVFRYYAICEVMMTAVYGNRYEFSRNGVLASLQGVYHAVLDERPNADPNEVAKDHLEVILTYNDETALECDPFDIDEDTGTPGTDWSDPLMLCIPSRHFMSANRSYYQKALSFVRKHNCIDDSVLTAVEGFHNWYEQQPNADQHDRLGILNIIASRGADLQKKPQQLRKKAEKASPAERKDLLQRAKKAEYSEVLGGAFSELISRHFEAPIIAELATRVPQTLPVRLVACKGDALVYLITTAEASRNFEDAVSSIDLSSMSPYALTEATCNPVDGEDTFGPEDTRQRKRKRANNEEGKAEKRDRLLNEIKTAIIDYAKQHGLIRIPNENGVGVVHHRVPSFPGCVYTELVRSRGATVGEVQTHDSFVQTVLSAPGPNGGLPHENLLQVWQNDSDGIDANKKRVVYGWLEMTHHEDFPYFSRGCVARGTWVALSARSCDNCETGLLHVIALKRIGEEMYAKYGFCNNIDAVEAELNSRWKEYWFPLREGGDLPSCPDRDGQSPIITKVTHMDKTMPDWISLDMTKMKVMGSMFPHMFEWTTIDGYEATNMADAVDITEFQRKSIMLFIGIFGFALIPGLTSPKMLLLLEGDSNCGKSCMLKVITMWLGLEDLTSIQNVKGGDKFSLMGLFARGYNKWAVCVDDLNVGLRDLCEDWKQLTTGGPVAFQAKNVNQTVANVYNEQLVTQSQQDMSTAAGFIIVTTNHVNTVLGANGPPDPGTARRLLPISFKESRRGPLNTRIEEMAEGTNGNCIDECLTAIVLSGQVTAYQRDTGAPFYQLLREPQTKRSWIETRQKETVGALASARYEMYTDYIAAHLEHKSTTRAFATFDEHMEGAAVDVTSVWQQLSSLNPRAVRHKFEEAVLHYFNDCEDPVSPPIVLQKEVRVCSTIPKGGSSGACSFQLHKFCQNCCTFESRRRTKRSVFVNLFYRE